ncbi:MAG: DUF1311 domain-containing protein [Rhodobacter sp.]|jgi:uncharacterized protein YecT (DUF1311 family)|nr:DUF1311 domain-containing protein [Rhodobacter sp.]
MTRQPKWALLAAALVLGTPAGAQELVFNLYHTQSCLDAAPDPAAQRACIGASANACMSATGMGGTTIGMSGCIDRELGYWDGRLNDSYQRLRARERSEDAGYGGAAGYVSQADALRDMQRAWIAFRDATCAYERAQWGGGTGGGPATVGCLMRMTGEQTLYLEQMAVDY